MGIPAWPGRCAPGPRVRGTVVRAGGIRCRGTGIAPTGAAGARPGRSPGIPCAIRAGSSSGSATDREVRNAVAGRSLGHRERREPWRGHLRRPGTRIA